MIIGWRDGSGDLGGRKYFCVFVRIEGGKLIEFWGSFICGEDGVVYFLEEVS